MQPTVVLLWRGRLARADRQEQRQQERLTSLLREVALLCKLRHPNIVSCFGCAVVGENVINNTTLPPMHHNPPTHVIMCMEYVSGGSLADLLSSFGPAPLPISSVRRFLRDCLKALGYLHQHYIVHRDVKPGNVLLHVDGSCKLSDFGTSVRIPPAHSSHRSNSRPDEKGDVHGRASKPDTPQIKSGNSKDPGVVVGTPLYMSPEQATGLVEHLSPASDLWSLGIMAVVLLSAENPYPSHYPTGSAQSEVAPKSGNRDLQAFQTQRKLQHCFSADRLLFDLAQYYKRHLAVSHSGDKEDASNIKKASSATAKAFPTPVIVTSFQGPVIPLCLVPPDAPPSCDASSTRNSSSSRSHQEVDNNTQLHDDWLEKKYCYDFLRQLLNCDPMKRGTALSLLSHPFLSQRS